MDVNSINNNISNLNSVPQQNQLSKTSSNGKIEAVSDDALSLNISQSYNTQRDELSNSLQRFNEGIAITKIAQNGLEKQREILTNIQDRLESSKQLEDRNVVKQDISEQLTQFNQAATETKYQRESLLTINPNSEENAISIETKEANYSISKINTPLITNELSRNLNELDLNDDQSLQTISNNVDESSNQINEIVTQFNQLSQEIQDKAKDTLTKQYELVRENQSNNVNFGKEASDFTKTNVTANVGYLAVSQANIVQEQSVRLLS